MTCVSTDDITFLRVASLGDHLHEDNVLTLIFVLFSIDFHLFVFKGWNAIFILIKEEELICLHHEVLCSIELYHWIVCIQLLNASTDPLHVVIGDWEFPRKHLKALKALNLK